MRKLYFLFFAFIHIAAYAQYGDMETVRQFGENLQLWCSTTDISYRSKIQDKCLSACRVKDEIMVDFARDYGLDIKDYVVSTYLNGFEKAMDIGTVVVDVSNIRIISSDQQLYSYGYAKKEEERAKNFTTIACNIKVRGTLNYDIKDLFYLQKGKILKITPYEEVVDKVTGKRKVKVDFSDLLEDTSTLGFTLNYDQHFQAGASIIGQSGLFICSLDFGFNTDSKKYYSDVMNMIDIMNYKRTKTEYDPKMFITVTPGLFFKYVSVGCGVGFAMLNGKETVSDSEFSQDEQGNWSGIFGSNSSDVFACKLMIRPQLRGFIPLSSSCKMSIGLGYDILPKAKELNGYNVSLGFHFDFDNWDGLFNWW